MPVQTEELLRGAAANPRVIGLAGGLPASDRFPRRQLTQSFVRTLNRPGIPALQYGWGEGIEPLRRRIVERLRRRGVLLDVDDVIITNGAQQAITITAQILLRRGSHIRVDPETYPSALTAFRGLGLVPTTSPRARVAYVMPAVGNPRGVAMTADARRAILHESRFIIEDDAYADLRFAGEAATPMLQSARGRVFYVGTFSKTLGPGLRVGFLIVPPRFRKRALRRKQDDDLQANSLSQTIVEDYLAHNDFDGFVTSLRGYYRRRARRLMAALREHVPAWRFEVPEGGFGLWVDTGASVDETRLLRNCIDAGVSFDPGSAFLGEPHTKGGTHLRLCFSAAPEAALEEGARRLARAWKRTLASARKRRGSGAK